MHVHWLYMKCLLMYLIDLNYDSSAETNWNSHINYHLNTHKISFFLSCGQFYCIKSFTVCYIESMWLYAGVMRRCSRYNSLKHRLLGIQNKISPKYKNPLHKKDREKKLCEKYVNKPETSKWQASDKKKMKNKPYFTLNMFFI